MNWNRNTYVGFWVHQDAEKQIAAVINKPMWNRILSPSFSL